MGSASKHERQGDLFSPASRDHSVNGAVPHYNQQTLEGLEAEAQTETIIDNCIVTASPLYKKKGKGHEWHCSLYALPDIFHQDRNELVEAHATTYAEHAHRKRLRPGDRVVLKGLLSQQELVLGNGETRTVNHLAVSDIIVIEKAERKSITVYEQQRIG